jgi:hypothetical protein
MDHTYKSFTKSDYNIINNIINNTILENTPENNYIGNADTFLINDYSNNIIINSITYYSYRLCINLMVLIIELTFIGILWLLTYYLVLRQYNCVRELFETI